MSEGSKLSRALFSHNKNQNQPAAAGPDQISPGIELYLLPLRANHLNHILRPKTQLWPRSFQMFSSLSYYTMLEASLWGGSQRTSSGSRLVWCIPVDVMIARNFWQGIHAVNQRTPMQLYRGRDSNIISKCIYVTSSRHAVFKDLPPLQRPF